MDNVRWGILSTAKIAVKDVIPAMKKGRYSEVTAIASRDLTKAEKTAKSLSIEKAFGSYEELLAHPDIDAIYNPLPNHLHVPWSIKVLQAGKHLLCEKPLGLSSGDIQKLADAARAVPDVKIMEAFMYKHHPRWRKALEVVQEGRIGSLKTVHTHFSYFNNNPGNIRNKPGMGGGSLMDIGCYGISGARFLFEKEPDRVFGTMEMDPELKVDRLTSGILHFENGQGIFSCATQMMRHQSVEIFGTEGRMDIPMPFNPSSDKPTHIYLWNEEGKQVLQFDPCNQYTLQGDNFSKAIVEEKDLPFGMDDAIANMKVIDAVVASNRKGKWVRL